MLVEKEVIRPGTYWYRDEQTGLPRKLVVTPELTKYWHDRGNAMLSAGLTVPVPCEHDFNAHPMTPAEKLKNNAGWVKEFRLKGDRLFSALDIQDADIAKKLPGTIRWTSPWISSFTDGNGNEHKNVITHLALTTRPRIIDQKPFGSVAAALSMATTTGAEVISAGSGSGGYCLSRAGRLSTLKKTKKIVPRYPLAFSLWAGGIKLSDDDFPPKKEKKDDNDTGDNSSDTDDMYEDSENAPPPSADGAEPTAPDADAGDANPLADATGDIAMEELLCDLLQALGVPMPDESNEAEFKRHLYEAAMSKIKELTSKGMGKDDGQLNPDQNQPPTQQPNASQAQGNPLIQQEQQPMYMSLEDINKIADPTMKSIALSMYNENAALRAKVEANEKTANSLRDATLKDATEKRKQRVFLLGKASPKIKADLEAMLALPAMALSMGEGGAVVDPMAVTLATLEKAVADLPVLLRTDHAALAVVPQPTDQSEMTDDRANEIADAQARRMGCTVENKKTA